MLNMLLSVLIFPFRVIATIADTLGPMMSILLAVGIGAWFIHR